MEKNWVVEVWGNWSHLGITTEIFFTKKEAEYYFKSIRKRLSSSEYIMTNDKIVDIEDGNNVILLTNLAEL